MNSVRGSLRRGSVLVLVMTLLGVLFVIGVAFLATMNFEAEMIAAQSHQDDRATAAEAVSDQVGMILQDVFANPSGGDVPYAEMPKVQTNFSPVEPMVVHDWGGDNVKGTGDDVVSVGFPWVADISAATGASAGLRGDAWVDPSKPQGWEIDIRDGTGICLNCTCVDGPGKGWSCQDNTTCPGSICKAPIAVDADGDGINDSVQVLASDLGLSEQQVVALASQVNPPSNPGGRVFAALRIVPHGGMVNLNYAHPEMIKNVFDLPSSTAHFYHRPVEQLVFYSPLIEEVGLRRRGILPAHLSSPSLLQGDPFAPAQVDDMNADMAAFLLWPRSGGGVQTVRIGEHRSAPFTPCDPFTVDCVASGEDSWWQYRMEPLTSAAANFGSLAQYDRRHLSTTVSHDDLLARGATVPAAGSQRVDMLTKMREANIAAPDPDACIPPFEYTDYPHDIPNRTDPTIGGSPCWCPTVGSCSFDDRKGRLKLSLPWLQRMIDAGELTLDPTNTLVPNAARLIHDVFATMLSNLVPPEPAFCGAMNPCPSGQGCDPVLLRCICGTSNNCQPGEYCVAGANGVGYCTSAANYWDNQECTADANCGNGEYCDAKLLGSATDAYGLCADSFTGLPRSQARVSRTAASLTANMIDFTDSDYFPTRIALRTFDFSRAVCQGGSNQGAYCRNNNDCNGSDCGNPAQFDPAEFVGHDIDLDPNLSIFKPKYVYGLEAQPFITAVSTVAEVPGAGQPPALTGWAIELFNPFNVDIPPANGGLESEYWLYEVPPNTDDPKNDPNILLTNASNRLIRSGLGRPFTVFYYEGGSGTPYSGMAPNPERIVRVAGGGSALKLANGSTLYLVWRFRFSAADPTYTDIVIDQFTIGGQKLGVDGTNLQAVLNDPGATAGTEYVFVDGRGVPNPAIAPNTADSVWLAPVPVTSGEVQANVPANPPNPAGPTLDTLLGAWHAASPNHVQLHPVVMGTADTGRFDTAFPTPGSMLLPLRLSNRDLSDFKPPTFVMPTAPPIPNLAFNTSLVGASPYTVNVQGPAGTVQHNVSFDTAYEIDNGRLPIFDTGQNIPGAGDFGIHHVPPQIESFLDPATFMPNDPTTWPGPGGLRSIPWGQLVFDYFTTLPLSNAGPYVCPPGTPPTECPPVSPDPAAKPRVDQDGLRVHGRVNLNVAPWKALAGVPFIPIAHLPAGFQGTVRTALNPTDWSGNPVADTEAGVLGNQRAQGIVAYREAREVIDNLGNSSGDYSDYPDPLNPTIVGGYRGWKNPTPQARRGTGFMSVGELANIRHPGDAMNPYDYRYRFGGVDPAVPLDPLVELTNAADNNFENFIAAAAPLIALNEWVSVRSHVFTVYGVFRGEGNPELDPSLVSHDEIQQDIISRALRFQETIDRLPTFLGRPLPQRIGDRTAGAYMDYRSN